VNFAGMPDLVDEIGSASEKTDQFPSRLWRVGEAPLKRCSPMEARYWPIWRPGFSWLWGPVTPEAPRSSEPPAGASLFVATDGKSNLMRGSNYTPTT
jgi:hypothetical protein